jgi:DNA integrity scanning protein DisA with diadenylate cyclase activity
MQTAHNHSQRQDGTDVTGETIQEALQALNKYLAMINGRLEILLLLDLPEYVTADLVKAYQAEQEASQIVRGLNIFCHKTF